MNTTENSSHISGFWPKTMWDVLNSEEEEKVLEHLCEAYCEPIRRWFEGRGMNRQDAEDAAAEFIGGAWIAKTFKIEQRKGKRFRGLLVTCLHHFRYSLLRRRLAQKRNAVGGVVPIGEHDDIPDAGAGIHPGDLEMDRDVAGTVHKAAHIEVARSQKSRGFHDRYLHFRRHVPGLVDTPDIKALASVSGLSEGNVKKQLHEMRATYYEVFEYEVRKLAPPAEYMEEYAHLLKIAATLPPPDIKPEEL